MQSIDNEYKKRGEYGNKLRYLIINLTKTSMTLTNTHGRVGTDIFKNNSQVSCLRKAGNNSKQQGYDQNNPDH